MPKPRERDPNDKIKRKGGGRPKRDIRRQMTAKLRKELVEQKRDGRETPADAQAVEQAEQTGAGVLRGSRAEGRTAHGSCCPPRAKGADGECQG